MDLFGVRPTVSGLTVSEQDALRVPAVSAAVRVISEAAAALEWSVVEKTASGIRPAPDHPANVLLTVQANSWTSPFELIRDLTAAALVRDEGALAWVNRPSGQPVEVIQMARGVISANFDPATREPSYRVNNRDEDSGNIVHLRSPFGHSPLTLAREAVSITILLERHAAKLFGKGARPSGALMFPQKISEEAVRKARAAWRATHEGDNPEGGTAILYDGATFEPFQFSSTDAQFLEHRKFQINEIARAFRVPPSMLFDLDRATWSNTEQMGREFLTYTLEPWLQALEGALNRALLTESERGRYLVRCDRDDLTRADLSVMATVINSLIASQTLNPNEARHWLGLPPREGGDQFLNPNITARPEAAREEIPTDDQ